MERDQGMAKQQQEERNSVHIEIEEVDHFAGPPTRINQIAPSHVRRTRTTAAFNQITPSSDLAGQIAKLLFFTHLLIVAILIIFLSVRGFISPKPPNFHHDHWYLPLIAAVAASFLPALALLLLTFLNPLMAIKASFWFAPFLSLAVAVILLCADSGGTLAAAALFLVVTLVFSLYACWVARRINYANKLLEASVSAQLPTATISCHVAAALAMSFAYSCFWLLGVGGVAARRSRFDSLYVLALLLSLAWTMHVVRNVLRVALGSAAYVSLTYGRRIEAAEVREAFLHATVHAHGGVCLGSMAEPVAAAVRSAARGMGIVSDDVDEFLFSCASCLAGVADRVIAGANQWGFVLVGAHGENFSWASKYAWEMFEKQGMVAVVDSDLTGSFCFYGSVAGGAMAAVVAGAWVFALGEGFVAGVALYGFIIGYFLSRIALAWPQACVMAYHVAYAENPRNQNLIISSAIADRVRELQSSSSD